MCVIVYKPEGKTLDHKDLKKCWESNSDGVGYMFPQGDGRLRIKKFLDFDRFSQSMLDTFPEGIKGTPLVVHFRFATSGLKDLDNAHPFALIPGRMGLVHNGVFSGLGDKKVCDTRHFIQTHLKGINYDLFFDNKSSPRNLLQRATKGSKLVLMKGTGEVSIINEDDGFWVDGVWYSNRSWAHTKTFQWSKKSKHVSSWPHGRCRVCNIGLFKRESSSGLCTKHINKGKDNENKIIQISNCCRCEESLGENDLAFMMCSNCQILLACIDCERLLLTENEQEMGYCDDCYTAEVISKKEGAKTVVRN